jgi:hypothetical protein
MYHLLNPKNIINEPKNDSNYKSNISYLTQMIEGINILMSKNNEKKLRYLSYQSM